MKHLALFPLVGLSLLATACITEMPPADPPVCQCPSPPEQPPEQPVGQAPDTFGSRLKPRVLTASDGTVFWDHASFVDTALDVNCTFSELPGAGRVCLPVLSYKHEHFMDPDCTKDVFMDEPCEEVPRYGRDTHDEVFGVCGMSGPGRIFRLGDPLPPDTKLYAKFGGDTCLEQPSALGQANIALPVLEEINVDTFVSGTL